MAFYWFMLCVLAVWRITHLLVAEEGPWQAVARIRARAARFTRLFDCFYCLSLWIAVPFAWFAGATLTHKALLWPALSGAAILLERITRDATASYREDEE